jgi:hypothetical protein
MDDINCDANGDNPASSASAPYIMPKGNTLIKSGNSARTPFKNACLASLINSP